MKLSKFKLTTIKLPKLTDLQQSILYTALIVIACALFLIVLFNNPAETLAFCIVIAMIALICFVIFQVFKEVYSKVKKVNRTKKW